jgi:hypothetical protein
MKRQPRKFSLSRETLRLMDDRRGPGGPVGTEPNSDLPNNTCFTLSCRHC